MRPAIVSEKESLRELAEAARRAGQRVSVVPTMGALHDGHLSLVRAAARRADYVIVTIFVNPTQFGPNEDLSRYPRTLDADIAACRAHGVDVIFTPGESAMYPPGYATYVEVTSISRTLEGEHRPTHFRGVTTIVCKLFHLIGPCVAIFGRKDYQQWRVISRMVDDLDLPVEVVAEPIVREPDGLALSSRNVYLTPPDRSRALALSRGLRAARAAFAGGERRSEAIVTAATAPLREVNARIDYVAVRDPEDLGELGPTLPDRAVLAIAAHIGETRLIDNIVLGSDPAI